MQKYKSPIIEIDEIDVNDVITTSSSTTPGGGADELPFQPADVGTISGTTGGKVTIGGGTTGGFTAGDLFGNR